MKTRLGLKASATPAAITVIKGRRTRRAEPYVAPPGSPPLRDVIHACGQLSKQLGVLDNQIATHIRTLEDRFRAARVERIFSVRLPDKADLGWSYDRRRRRWRFVIRTEDDAWDLLACSPEEWSEVFTCGAMTKLIVLMKGP